MQVFAKELSSWGLFTSGERLDTTRKLQSEQSRDSQDGRRRQPSIRVNGSSYRSQVDLCCFDVSLSSPLNLKIETAEGA